MPTHESFNMPPAVRAALIAMLCATSSLTVACKKENGESHETQKVEVTVPDRLGSAKAELNATVQSYEKLRSLLATDQVAAVGGPADQLASAATTAAIKTPTELRTPLTDIAEASSKLQQMPKDDADAVRKQFGEVSRAYVALLKAEPGLQTGLHVFECPMAQGYKQWVQPSDKIDNPYMGSRMLECGVPGKWE